MAGWRTLVIVLPGLLLGGAARADIGDTQLEPSPPGHVVIVNNNAQEAFVSEDVADPTDMRNLARRAVELVPYVPDIVLLQEVVRPSIHNVADFLTEETGFSFEVVVSPEDSAWVYSDEDEEVIRDAGIIINTDTMEALDDGGFIATTYELEDSSGDRVRTKEHAFGSVQEREGGLELPIVTLHFIPNRYFSDEEVGWRYKSQWTEEIGSFMNRTYPPTSQRHVPTIAGDFNNRRCLHEPPETIDCDVFPFWDTLTEELDYVDAIFSVNRPGEIGTRKRIDYIFGRGRVVDAASDLTYDDEEKADPERFYSDHRLMWATIAEPPRE